jgi:Mor family transcriptional regulator
MKKAANDLKAIAKQLNALAKKTETLAKTLDKAPKKTVKKKAATIAKKKAAPKARAATPTDQVLTIMKRFKKGISVEALRGKSGFSEKQISNIVHRACQKGKMKRIGRGVYSVYGL